MFAGPGLHLSVRIIQIISHCCWRDGTTDHAAGVSGRSTHGGEKRSVGGGGYGDALSINDKMEGRTHIGKKAWSEGKGRL